MGSKNKKRDRQDTEPSSATAMGSEKKRKGKGAGQRPEGAGNGNGGGGVGKIITDPRYSSVHSAPIFQRVPRDKAKVEIDYRFQAMFTDKRFAASTAKLDKRGRVKDRASVNPLRRYYHMEEEEKEEEEEEEEEESESGSEELERGIDVAKSAQVSTESEGSESESESEDEAVSADSESTTDTDEEDEADVYEEEEAEPQESIPNIEKETHRLAVVNMDWMQVKAVDLYVLLSSFLPKEGRIVSVSVYPSDFGVQRMKEEEVHGPVGLSDYENDSDDENEEGNIDTEKLRAYEKSRLRYYYAVVECDSIATADYLYKTCDGLEFERSSNVLDLRFIPDTMEFKHSPRDVATKAPANYEGLDFETRALQQTDIHLTWDEDEPDRVRTLKRKLDADQLAELELKEFLASDESGSDEDEEKEDLPGSPSDEKKKKREKYLALLQGDADSDDNDEGDEDKQDMEITFNTGLEELSKRLSEKKEQKSESVFEANLRKRREKKKMMRKNKSNESSDDEEHGDTDSEGAEEAGDDFFEKPATKKSKKAGQNKANKAEKERQDLETEASIAELELLVADETGDNGPKGYNIKRRKANGKQGSEDPEEDIAKIPTTVTDDPRFAALFTSPDFAVDPTDPQYKRSAAYLRQVALNRSKGGKRERDNRESEKTPSPVSDKAEMAASDQQSTRKHELSSLVRSLKMKSQQLQLPKNDGKLRVREKVTKEKHESSGVQSIKKKKKNKN